MKNEAVLIKDENQINEPFVQVVHEQEDANLFFNEDAISENDAIESSIDQGD